MQPKTKLQYKALVAAMAKTYAVESTSGEQFAVSEPLETTLNQKIQESVEFLSMINVLPHTDLKGQALELGFDGLIARRTDTDSKDRTGSELGAPNGSTWEMAEMEFDVFIKYKTMDTWNRMGNLRNLYMSSVYRCVGLDRMTIGWHGTSVAAGDSDPVANPLGQDLNKGWPQILRDQAPEQVMEEGNHTGSGKIFVGANENNLDYQNLDALVGDLYNNIPVEHRTGNEVAIVGSALVAADSNKVLNAHAGQPTEKAVGITTLTKSYGGLKAIQVPRFPANGVFVGDLKHLHLYYQDGTMRRQTEDIPKRKRVADYISANECYAIGDMKAVAMVEPANIVIVTDKTAAGDFPDPV